MKNPDNVNPNSDSTDLIAEICLAVHGIGQSRAFAIAEDFEGNWKAFIKADQTRLLSIKNSKGKNYLTPKQAEEIQVLMKDFEGMTEVRAAWAFLIGKGFLTDQIQSLQEFSLENIDVNPFLMKVLDLKTPRDIIEFNLYQSVTRSIVTSWGSAVESLLVRCGGVRFVSPTPGGRAGRKPDIVKKRDGTTYYIQIKSGPNTMNVDMVNSLNEIISEYKKKEAKSRFLLGMTYGRKNRISAQIRGNLHDFENSALIGRELWDFVSEEKNYHRKMFALLDAASKSISAKSFSERLELRLVELIREWDKKFDGKTLDEAFESFI